MGPWEYKSIIAADSAQEVWRILRLLSDEKTAAAEICRLHNLGTKEKANAQKQVRQIGYCIWQAEEYFHVASQVGLATRPLLLYYGATSLGRALVLFKKDCYASDELGDSP